MSDSNKLVGLDSLSILAKQLKANIKEDLLGDKKLRYVTLEEYEALSDAEKNNNSIVWNIVDADDLILNDFSTQVDWNETDPESPKYILNKPNLDALLGELDFSTLEFDTTGIVFDSNYVPPSEPDIPDVPTPPEPEVELSSISASYTGGQVEVGTPISSLKNLTVTAWYTNDTSEVITNYTITEGNIVEGRNIIEVSYQGKTATFEVTGYIEQVELSSISVSYTGGQVKVGTPISSLGNITVKAWYTNDTSKDITDYTIVTEGNIAEGENIIEVTYQGKTATFKVTGYTTSINTLQVVYNGGNKEYGTVTIEDLKPYLAVTAYYSDGTKDENITDYEIIGELKKGQNSLTVSYRGKTAKFTVYLETKIYSIKIVPVPSDAKVKIDGSNIYSKNVESGTTVTYEVSKDGYETKTGEIVVTKNEEITVELSVVKNISAVRANWSGPQIPYGSTLDDLRQYLEVKAEYPDGSSEIVTDYELSGELKKNSNNKITVTYKGKTADFYVWAQVVNYTVNISVIPSDAKVMLNGRNSRSENVESGSTVTYEVSKNGYITQSGEILVMKNENITITLVEQTE